MTKENEELKARNAALEERVAKLEKAAKPPEPSEPFVMPRIDYTQGMTMGRSAMQAMIDAVPESVMAGIRADARKPNPIQASQAPLTSTTPSAHQSQPQRKVGWIEPRPLESPPGLKYIDAQVDAQDAKDRAELALKLAKVELSKRSGEQ
jgi:hypothetical protein